MAGGSAPVLALELHILPAALEVPGEGAELDDRRRIKALEHRIAAEVPPVLRPGRIERLTGTLPRIMRQGYMRALRALPDWRGEALVLREGVFDLGTIAAHPASAEALTCSRTVCSLRLPLLVGRDATLMVTRRGGSPFRLRMVQATGAFLAVEGRLFMDGAVVNGWDEERARLARTDEHGAKPRPFIAALDGARLLVRYSRLSHLGFDGAKAYGLTLSTTDGDLRPSGQFLGNRIAGLFYGFYSFEAHDVVLIGNRFSRSIRYGIDPHDRTSGLVIADNIVEHTRLRHGIILSKDVSGALISGNRSEGNAGSGIVLDVGADRSRVIGNELDGNGGDGIAVYESDAVLIAHNHIDDNARSGLRLRDSREVTLRANTIRGNGLEGVGAGLETLTGDGEAHSSAVMSGNRFIANPIPCRLTGLRSLTLIVRGSDVLTLCNGIEIELPASP